MRKRVEATNVYGASLCHFVSEEPVNIDVDDLLSKDIRSIVLTHKSGGQIVYVRA